MLMNQLKEGDNEYVVLSQRNETSGHYLRAGFGSEP